ncbi:cytochrome c [Neptunomonas sp.]|uniref:c-type cytochrome n=1 Tax=Neptunomonas sp. TaxID=1971898 RepID=UPI0025CBEB49|nr:cytochrome c [Neptunomonas sp.]
MKVGFSWLILAASIFLVLPVSADSLSARQQELEHLLKHDCGSCHGMTLQGGLGSSLLPGDLKERSDDALFQAIKQGLPGLAMPPWGPLLSDSDIHWLVERLRKGSM